MGIILSYFGTGDMIYIMSGMKLWKDLTVLEIQI